MVAGELAWIGFMRELLRRASVCLDLRRFLGYGLAERLPVHQTLSHAQTRRFEVFAEGGGNAFGCEIDAQGRVFSGHNGGDTRGLRLRLRSTPGAPTTGAWSKGTMILDSAADLFICTAAGTPGTWKKVGAP